MGGLFLMGGLCLTGGLCLMGDCVLPSFPVGWALRPKDFT